MLYSTIDRNTWDEDEWVKNLPPVTQSRDAHLLHIYLFSNRRAGITACYTISLDRAARECHFEGADDPCFRAAWICLVRDRRIRYFEEHGIVWVPAFIRHQRNVLGANFRRGMGTALCSEVPAEIAEEVIAYNHQYGIELTVGKRYSRALPGTHGETPSERVPEGDAPSIQHTAYSIQQDRRNGRGIPLRSPP